MPGMSGQQLYRLISDINPALARMIIFITGDTARSEAGDFIRSTGNRMLAKPFDLAELRQKIQELAATEE